MSQVLSKKKQKSPLGKKKAKRPAKKSSKTNATKEKLLSNAMQVFTKSPYKTASLRNICSSHTLVSYHFGSKVKLFQSLTSKIIDNLNDHIPLFGEGMEKMPPKKGLNVFIRNFLDYLSVNPESMMVISQNLGNSDETKVGFAGLDIMEAVYNQVYTVFLTVLPDKSSKKDLKRWCMVLLMYIINFYGSVRTNQIVLNLKPYQHTYQKWVEEFMMFHLYPSYNHLMLGSESKEFEDHPGNRPIIPPVKFENDGTFSFESKSGTKGDITRKRILKAARTIFAKYPYEVASIRMIGKEGKMDFTLIHHYFPTKEHLFQENAKEMFLEIFLESFEWYKNLHLETLYSGLDVVTDRIINYFINNNNEAISTLMQNMAGTESLITNVPGFRYITRFIEEIRRFDPTEQGGRQYQMYQYGQALIHIYFLGASHYFAKMLGINPNGNTYKKWLQETNKFVLYPVLRRYVSGEK